MSIQEAMKIVAKACAEFHGTLHDHKTIQLALKTIADKLESAGVLPAEPEAREEDHGNT